MKVKDLIEELQRLDGELELELVAKVRANEYSTLEIERTVKIDKINSVPRPTIILVQ